MGREEEMIVAKRYRVTPMKRLVSAITASLARRGMGNFVVVETKGRRSGEPRHVTVAPVRRGASEYLVSPYGEVSWVRNVRSDPEVTLERGGRRRPARLVEVTGEHPDIVEEYYHREAYARRFMPVPEDPSGEDFRRTANQFPVFRIEPVG